MNEDIVALLEDLGKDLATDVIANYISRNPELEEVIATKTVAMFTGNQNSPYNSDLTGQVGPSINQPSQFSDIPTSIISPLFSNLPDISLKMVFVVNMSLKMGRGKQCAQVGHATLALYGKIQQSGDREIIKRLDQWTSIGQKKIVVKAENLSQMFEVRNAAEDSRIPFYLVSDAGCTQISPGSKTVLGVFGNDKELQSVTGHLKLL